MFNLVRHSGSRPANGVEFLGPASTESKSVESIHAHAVHVAVAGKIEPDNDDEIRENEDGSLEVVALAFAIDVRQQEDAQDHGDHVPLGEDEAVCVVSNDDFQPDSEKNRETYLKEWLAREAASIERVYRALNSTRAGTCNRQTWSA
jgi:hypothetical protein